MNICVLIPVHNEAQGIGPVVEALRAKDLDVIVIDDGSMDGSGDIAKAKGATVLRYDKKNGKGYSLQRGFEYVLKHRYEGVITMDGDGQHDPNEVEQFLKEARGNPTSLIIGNRMQNSHGMPFVRYLTNCFMSGLISLACRQSIPDTQCGYRYLSKEVLKSLELTCADFEIETEILMKACKKGFKIASTPIQTIYRDEESKIHPFKDTVRFFIYFFRELCSSKK